MVSRDAVQPCKLNLDPEGHPCIQASIMHGYTLMSIRLNGIKGAQQARKIKCFQI